MNILKALSRRKTCRSHYDGPLRRDENYEEIDMTALRTPSSTTSSPEDSLPLSQPPTPLPHRRDPEETKVKLRRLTDGGRRVFVNLPLPSYELNADGSPKRRFVSNRVRTSKYTPLTFVPKNLFEQFRRAANMYFLAQAILQLIPYFGIKNPALTVLPICVVVAISAVKDGFEDYQRHKVDARYNSTVTYTLIGYDNVNYPTPKKKLKKQQQRDNAAADATPSVDSEKKGYFGRSVSMDVRVGDFILLRNGESCPADAVLLSSSDPTGVCFVETKDLDGETNLKPRYGVQELSHIQSGTECLNDVHLYVEAPAPTPDLYQFEGTMVLVDKQGDGWKERKKVPISIDNIVLRGHVVRNTHWAVAVVLYTGPESKIILNSNKTPSKRSRIEKHMNQEIIIAFIVLVLLCLICAILAGVMKAEDDADAGTSLYSQQTDSPAFVGFMNFWSSLIIFQNIIPISLYVSIEFIKTFHAYFIWSDIDMYDEASDTPCVPKSWNLSDDLGQVEYLFSDKTGTLTRNIMEFRECSIGGKRYGNNGFAPESEGARGARLRREKDELRISQQTAATEEDSSQQANLLGTTKEAAVVKRAGEGGAGESSLEKQQEDEARSFQQRRAVIFEEYTRALTSLFTPKYSSLDPNRLAFADPAVLWDLHPVDSSASDRSKATHDSAHRDRVQEFFMDLALCHTVIVEKIDKNGKAIIEGDDENGEWDDDEKGQQPQVVEEDNTPATTEKTTRFREAMKNRGRRFKRRVKGERRVVRHASRASRASTRGEEFESIANVERPDIVDMTVETQIVYKAESPDEAALVSAARDVGFAFVARQGKQLFVDFLGTEYEFELLNILEFNSTRKRMSVIVKRPEPWNDIVLYCKGADNVILERLGSDTQSKELVQQTQDDIDTFSNDGLRTLVLAYKHLDPKQYEDWSKRYEEASTAAENRVQRMEALQDEMERQLTLLGATGIEDKLQEGVPQCIEDLRHAGIKVWVLTGDKLETAINIGYASSLLEADMQLWILRGTEGPDADLMQEIQDITTSMSKHPDGPENALIIEGAALTYLFETPERKQALLQVALLCKSVVCCRVSPLQKALVVEMVKDGVGAVTLAVGDGANDVSMIQSANIGVGIAGQEGVQASMSSNYAIGQFRFLQKLLLVQGHWNYRRTSEMILNFFFKNLLFILPPLWFQIFSRFSGGLFYDYSLHQLYNVIFTVAPAVVLGCSDQDITAPFLRRFPQTYEVGTQHLLYTRKLYCLYCLDAAWQSLVLYFGYYFIYNSKDPHPNGLPTSNLEFSTAVALAVVLLANIMPGFNTWYWTWFQFFFVAFGIVFTFLFVLIYGLFESVDIYGMGFMVYSDLSFWMTLILVTVVAFLPRYVAAFVNQWFFPDVVSTGRHLELDERRRKRRKQGKRCCC